MGLRILIDTNVILDYLLDREPYEEPARMIIKFSQKKEIEGCVAAHSITNIFYILRKNFSVEERRVILLDICKIFHVEGIDVKKLRNALVNEEFPDFEDCLQMECARDFRADYIVSRNLEDFKNSNIPCVAPDEMCRIIKSERYM